jgi:glycosyltransferase involved in cell wall biosynthesis
MQEADVFLFLSIHEGFPKVTIEVAATKTASIVFNNYRPETVLNGETGFIVRDVEEMMNKLTILIRC